jgi:hypothetical protein
MNIARLLVAEEYFGACAYPFHRAPELLRRVEERAVFRIGIEAHAEAAAGFLGDDPTLSGGTPRIESCPRMGPAPCVVACRKYMSLAASYDLVAARAPSDCR